MGLRGIFLPGEELALPGRVVNAVRGNFHFKYISDHIYPDLDV
jgi:hypothetical protein